MQREAPSGGDPEVGRPPPPSRAPAKGRRYAVNRPRLDVGRADIVAVSTAQELQEAALSGIADIEVRAHMDLRVLARVENPAIEGPETPTNPKSFALLYASGDLRSIRVRPLRLHVLAALQIRRYGRARHCDT